MDELGGLESAGETLDAAGGELYEPFGDGEEGVVVTAADAVAWADFGAALAYDNVANTCVFASVFFNTKTLAVGITAV